MTPDTGPNESANQNDEYLNNAPPYNFPPDSSSDEEEEDDGYIGNDADSDGGGDNMAGYQLLNQEDGGGDRVGRDNLYSRSEDHSENHHHPIQDTHHTNPANLISSNSLPMADLPPPPIDEITNQLESIPRPDIELDEVKIDQIKQAMSGFNLPSSSIPGWASVITEDQLANFVHCKTKPNQSH